MERSITIEPYMAVNSASAVCPALSFVKIAVDDSIISERRHSLVDIDNRVEYDCIGSADDAECEGREVINESLKHGTLCCRVISPTADMRCPCVLGNL